LLIPPKFVRIIAIRGLLKVVVPESGGVEKSVQRLKDVAEVYN